MCVCVWGGGAENFIAMLKGGTNSFEVVLTQELEALAILICGGGGGGGVQKVSYFVPLSP